MTAEDLRKSILQQAIQGKLVPQDPNDEPASILLERIREEKARLVKEKKIKKDKNESIIYRGDDNSYYEKFADGSVKCIDEEIPFEIPETWRWCRLIGCCTYIHRGKSPKYGTEKILPIIAQKCNQWDKIHSDRCLFSNKDSIEKYCEEQYVRENDIIINSTGKGTVGRTGIIKKYIFEKYSSFVVDSHVTLIRPHNEIVSDYIYRVFLSSLIQSGIEGKCSGSTNQIELATLTIENFLIPLPPYTEQQRIVEKIDELLGIVQRFEKFKVELDSLETNLQPQLKKSILQYAIQGKLVPQCSTDESASELLKRIQEEKERLISEGKIKREKTTSFIYRGDDNKYFEKKGNEVVCIDDEIPFDIPDTWEWVRMGCIGDWGAGATPSRANSEYYKNGTILWLKTGELNDSVVYDTLERVTEKALLECSLRLNKVGDVLIAMYGATIGKIAIVGKELTTNQACCGCTPFNGVYNKYLFYYLMANKDNFIRQGEGGAQPNISRDKLIKFLFPMPPLDEQKRIVEALDNVLASIMRK